MDLGKHSFSEATLEGVLEQQSFKYYRYLILDV